MNREPTEQLIAKLDAQLAEAHRLARLLGALGAVVLAGLLLLLHSSATSPRPKRTPAPEIKAQRHTEEQVAVLRERLAAEDVADAAAWQQEIDAATGATVEEQLNALAKLARSAKARRK